VRTYIGLDSLVKGLVFVVDHQGFQFGVLVRQYGVFVAEARVVSLEELVYFLQLFYLKHPDLVALSVFALAPNVVRHQLNCLLAKSEVTLKHSLLGKVFRLEVAQNHFELGDGQS